ncbi:hypothetical protein EV361DRAFT_470823 [Lentinula raphanica]|uniref:TRAF-type domain-containing protein n=1 Tax=Lentinula raphanica TaxID=153919 RepID=A0AA38PHC0_9AGAR|nr:hypothetical protein F5878DRAFT_344498 [Lentinula raphanica]KAJ3977845.1 hypothetical protein EV361DRAFT_470823 [Lentinula raphanica]
MPFVDPYTNQTCSHTFCRECITQSLAHSPQCPVDRSNLRIEDIHPADPIIRSLVDELIVKCSNETAGCSYTCQRQLLDAHIKTDCSYAPVPCPVGGCSEEILRKDQDQHVCAHVFVSCEDCKYSVRNSELEKHYSSCPKKFYQCKDCNSEQPCSSRTAHASSCQSAMVKCSHEHHGCPWEGRRKDFSSHTTTCAYEAIKGFFAIHDAQKSTLVNQNDLLKQKADMLESQLRVAQFELRCAQRALGPWFQNSEPRSTSVHSPPARLPSVSTQSTGALSSSHPYMASDSQASIDHYFPEVLSLSPTREELRAPPPAPERPQFGPSVTLPHASFSGASVQNWQGTAYLTSPTGPRPSTQNVVAPLDLSTTLEGSLEGLRESIVSLSASLDSLGRRNEIALANETLRLNEEVLSLRAALQGLRMQVHTIMMDRNAQITGRGPSIDPLFMQGEGSQWPHLNRTHILPNSPPNSITKL